MYLSDWKKIGLVALVPGLCCLGTCVVAGPKWHGHDCKPDECREIFDRNRAALDCVVARSDGTDSGYVNLNSVLVACGADKFAYGADRWDKTVGITLFVISFGLGHGRTMSFIHTKEQIAPGHWMHVTPYGDDWYLVVSR